MRRSTGFTLIELIIVIIILGILAVTAAPKFIDVTNEAHRATLLSIKMSINGANNLVNAKSNIAGNHKLPYKAVGGPAIKNGKDTIALAYGFTVASEDAVTNIIDFDQQVFGVKQGVPPNDPDGGNIYIYIRSRTTTDGDPEIFGGTIDQIQVGQCYVSYASATKDLTPTYIVESNGC